RRIRKISWRFLSVAADGIREKTRWRPALQACPPGKSRGTRATLGARLSLHNRPDHVAGNRLQCAVQQGVLCSHVRARHRRSARLRRALEIVTPDEIRPVRCGERHHGRSNQKRTTRRNSQTDAQSPGSFQNARSVRLMTKSECRSSKKILISKPE